MDVILSTPTTATIPPNNTPIITAPAPPIIPPNASTPTNPPHYFLNFFIPFSFS